MTPTKIYVLSFMLISTCATFQAQDTKKHNDPKDYVFITNPLAHGPKTLMNTHKMRQLITQGNYKQAKLMSIKGEHELNQQICALYKDINSCRQRRHFQDLTLKITARECSLNSSKVGFKQERFERDQETITLGQLTIELILASLDVAKNHGILYVPSSTVPERGAL